MTFRAVPDALRGLPLREPNPLQRNQLGPRLSFVRTQARMISADVTAHAAPRRRGTLYRGDNLEVLRRWVPGASVDLIYLDPPFNSGRSYDQVVRGSPVHLRAFTDAWAWDDAAVAAYREITGPHTDAPRSLVILMEALHAALTNDKESLAYLSMMAVRIVALYRALAPTGSFYLHCDPTASHYIKLLLDAVFGPEHFRSEIIWKRTFAHGSASRWGDVHDVLLFYTKGASYTWNRVHQPYDPRYLASKYKHTDARGRFRLVVLTAPGVTSKGESGEPWRGYDPTRVGRHWAIPKDALDLLREEGVTIPEGALAQLDLLCAHDLLRIPQKRGGKTGVPEYKRYLAADGQPIQDIIVDIPPVNSQAAERLGYPTQKPLALLERIVAASSNPGDIVLDPFCGCGTTIEAAEKLQRSWLGIDIAPSALDLIRRRLGNLGVEPEVIDLHRHS